MAVVRSGVGCGRRVVVMVWGEVGASVVWLDWVTGLGLMYGVDVYGIVLQADVLMVRSVCGVLMV